MLYLNLLLWDGRFDLNNLRCESFFFNSVFYEFKVLFLFLDVRNKTIVVINIIIIYLL